MERLRNKNGECDLGGGCSEALLSFLSPWLRSEAEGFGELLKSLPIGEAPPRDGDRLLCLELACDHKGELRRYLPPWENAERIAPLELVAVDAFEAAVSLLEDSDARTGDEAEAPSVTSEVTAGNGLLRCSHSDALLVADRWVMSPTESMVGSSLVSRELLTSKESSVFVIKKLRRKERMSARQHIVRCVRASATAARRETRAACLQPVTPTHYVGTVWNSEASGATPFPPRGALPLTCCQGSGGNGSTSGLVGTVLAALPLRSKVLWVSAASIPTAASAVFLPLILVEKERLSCPDEDPPSVVVPSEICDLTDRLR